MTTRLLATLTVASSALAAASPAMAQPAMTYGDRYEYARPAPVPSSAPPVIYQSQPVVQPIPTYTPTAPATYVEDAAYEVEHEYREAPAHYRTSHGAPVHSTHRGGHYPAAYPQGHHGAPQAGFDHEAWLDECEDRFRSRYRDSDGNVIGGLLGAAAGGVIGNRVADGNRLAGTLIGAGVGGLAGLAIGSAIDAASAADRRRDGREYCEDYLSRYSYGHRSMPTHGHGYAYAPQHHGYAQYYQVQPMMLVPVRVPVQQRAVVREYVTEEYVDVPVTTYEEVPAYRTIKSAPVKTRSIKARPVKRQQVKIRYRK